MFLLVIKPKWQRMNSSEIDIVVGIPSYNNARTIGHVVSAVDAGLAKYFPDKKAVIVNSDGGSKDGTSEIVKNAVIDRNALLLKHPLSMAHRITTPYHGIPGKGSAIRTIFTNAVDMGADACAIVDSDLRSITPEWIELLLKPVLSGTFDFVAPLYARHKFDGTITNSIVYPMTRALYGKKIRQPIGGEFGFSRRLMEHYLNQDVWGTDVARFGIDIWMTTEAIANGFNICQAFLGAKIHDPKDPGSDLSDMLVQVVGSLFELTERHYDVWKTINSVEEVETFGFKYYVALDHIKVDVSRMLRTFREGLKNLQEIWIEIIGSGDFNELRMQSAAADAEFRFSPELWARIVYDFALAYKKRKLPPQQLIKSLMPLYLGKTASFVMDVDDKSQTEAEAEIEKLCLQFEKTKYHLANGWK
ncbi:MAG: glycosyl transferase family 2 [Thermodesulfovibrio sp.]|nr:glycosyl transferase family 2 [Thermodesulfovibrio sp.]